MHGRKKFPNDPDRGPAGAVNTMLNSGFLLKWPTERTSGGGHRCLTWEGETFEHKETSEGKSATKVFHVARPKACVVLSSV
jgi:hypothetical protein